ncbi:hypothetical protein A9Q87_13560 [Flavobacteriales bacterium 34_180_T64]|nr:hypothetical protein A9Q87_13560 [Flavobacteriales bacterium 34_180_T64]
MRFIRYYSKLLDAQGMPHLSVTQHKRLFNIISLESRVDELQRLKDNAPSMDLKYKYDVRIHRLKKSLVTLTKDELPKNIMNNMLWKSDN